MGKKTKGIQPQHERFCAEYLIDYNGTAAAIRAGYAEKTAYSQAGRLLKNQRILERIRVMQGEKVRRLGISADYVVLRLVEVLDRAMQSVEVEKWDYETHQLVGSGTYQFDGKTATRTLELLGKNLGVFESKKEPEISEQAKQILAVATMTYEEKCKVLANVSQEFAHEKAR